MTGQLEGKIALITGSDSGIGQGTAVEFAKEGADIVVHFLKDRAGAESTKRQVEACGRRAVVVQADVREEAQVERMFDEALQAFGTLDILMNNAGIDASGKQVAEMPTEVWDRAIKTNLYGYFYCCRRFIKIRRDAGGGGKIINVTSVHEEIPRAGAADYDCAKGAERNLTRTLALELAPDKINVNNIAPGMVLTPFNQPAIDDPKVREQQVQSIPWKRAAEPTEIGRLAVFLASADSDYVTGSTYVMDGGLMQNQGKGHDMFGMGRSVPLELTDPGPLAEMYTLSPFVWRAGERYRLLLRAVNRAERQEDKVARIHYGESEDGVHFQMEHQPVIAPGPDPEDQDGCEDPTVAVVDDTLYIYYTGWNQAQKEGQLLLAAGPSPNRLQKRGVAIPSSEAFQNPKEASIGPCKDGTWRLFFEYATQGASRVGMAFADSVDGPWAIQAPPFTVRNGSWDSWHLSPGPILLSDPAHPIMFYNGSTEEIAWRVGWIMFDASYTRVVARCEQPLFKPPVPDPGYRDIAFAASSVQGDGDIWLYYSLADKDMMRGTLHQSPDPT